MKKFVWIFLVLCISCEGLRGPMGPQGPAGVDLWVEVKEGTILSYNYTEGNPHAASIPLGDHSFEPIVLFLGIENENGVYRRIDFSAVIYGGSDSNYAVRGTSGYYVLVYDPNQDLVQSNYQVKFIPGTN